MREPHFHVVGSRRLLTRALARLLLVDRASVLCFPLQQQPYCPDGAPRPTYPGGEDRKGMVGDLRPASPVKGGCLTIDEFSMCLFLLQE